jgi:hypothetical protein
MTQDAIRDRANAAGDAALALAESAKTKTEIRIATREGIEALRQINDAKAIAAIRGAYAQPADFADRKNRGL